MWFRRVLRFAPKQVDFRLKKHSNDLNETRNFLHASILNALRVSRWISITLGFQCGFSPLKYLANGTVSSLGIDQHKTRLLPMGHTEKAASRFSFLFWSRKRLPRSTIAYRLEKRGVSLANACFPLRNQEEMTRRLWVLEWFKTFWCFLCFAHLRCQ